MFAKIGVVSFGTDAEVPQCHDSSSCERVFPQDHRFVGPPGARSIPQVLSILCDSQTYWVLTGTAVRIGQCIGVHRDGESLGLPPFDVQMRRRMFYQLLPLDRIASQIADTGAFTMPESWNTKPPLNLNDDQIWPGMVYTPEEQTGATEMILCLLRICVGKHFAVAGNPVSRTGLGQFNNYHDAENAINKAENELEEKYIRYCDVVDPLHLLSMATHPDQQVRAPVWLSLVSTYWQVRSASTRVIWGRDFAVTRKICDLSLMRCKSSLPLVLPSLRRRLPGESGFAT